MEKYIITGIGCIPDLKRWIKKFNANGCSIHYYEKRDIIWIGNDSDPDGDWGKFTHYAKIIINNKLLTEKIGVAVGQALWGENWKPKK